MKKLNMVQMRDSLIIMASKGIYGSHSVQFSKRTEALFIILIVVYYVKELETPVFVLDKASTQHHYARPQKLLLLRVLTDIIKHNIADDYVPHFSSHIAWWTVIVFIA